MYMKKIYRPDIDGLRSLAVLPIVLYHAGISGFNGGFVGVDIFFVISGYLITQIIHFEIQTQSFSILKFYARRARRILPALFFMCICVVILSWYILLPSDFKNFSLSLFWTMAFSSNIHFWQEAGYFAGPSEYKPLLHTWSLAVEEQFYLLFPISLVLISKYFSRYINNFILSGFILSLILSVWGVSNEPNATFYLLPSRAWELLLGSILALNIVPISHNKLFKNLTSFIGAALIFWSVFTFSETTKFPGLNALFPCVGTFLLIYSNSNGQTWMGKLLSLKPFVFFGLISYSLYLWHWPLIVFLKYTIDRPFSVIETILVLLISVAMAVLSWRYIEQPFRRPDKKKPQEHFYYASCFVALTLVTFAFIGYYTKGFPGRWSSNVLLYDSVVNESYKRDGECSSISPEMVLNGKLCHLGQQKNSSTPDFIVWGDSHSLAHLQSFEKMSKEARIFGLFASNNACIPLLDIYLTEYPSANTCRQYNDAIFSLIQKNKIKNVFLISRWSVRAEGYEKGGGDTGPQPYIGDDVLRPTNSEENKIVFKNALTRTLSRLADNHINVYILEQTPEFNFNVPKMLARAAAHDKDLSLIGRPLEEHLVRQSFVKALLDELEAKYKFTRLDPTNKFCSNGFCLTNIDGHSLYKDDDHVSLYGAVWMSDIFESSINAIVKNSIQNPKPKTQINNQPRINDE